MNLETYKNFIAIVEEGSILAASKKQMIAQPALSAQLARLEAHYKAPLLIRGARHVRLTEAGNILYQKAKRMVELEAEAADDIESSLDGRTGVLSLALPSASSPKFLAFLLRDFMERYPRVRICVHESDSQEAAECVSSGLAEVGFVKTPITESYRFTFFPMPSTPVAAVFSKDLADEIPDALTLEYLNGKEIVVPKGCQSIILSTFEERGIRARLACVTTTRNAAIQLARMRRCAALVPYDAEEEARGELLIRQLTDASIMIPRQFIIQKGAALSNVARRFLEIHQLALPEE